MKYKVSLLVLGESQTKIPVASRLQRFTLGVGLCIACCPSSAAAKARASFRMFGEGERGKRTVDLKKFIKVQMVAFNIFNGVLFYKVLLP